MYGNDSISDDVMQQAVVFWDFIWAYGFAWERLREAGLSAAQMNSVLVPALVRGINPPNLKADTREIPEEHALALWVAMRDGEMAAVDRLLREHWVFEPISEVGA